MTAAGFGTNTLQEYGSSQHNALSVCTNACWAIGEAAVTSSKSTPVGVNMKEVMGQYSQQICRRIVTLLGSQKLNKALAQNLACAMGRLSLAFPEVLTETDL